MITWNINHRDEPWRLLLRTDADIALLQEAGKPPADVADKLEVDAAPWMTAGTGNRAWRTAVVKLSDRVRVQWLGMKSIEEAQGNELGVSQRGTIAAAHVSSESGENFTVASMYALWERPHPSTNGNWIYADASAHRVISDLAALVGQQRRHRIIAAGDLNILYGYGEHGSRYWASRYQTVFDRMSAMGLAFVGPQFPLGLQATPRPTELPTTSANVPTYYYNRQTAATATRQLDFVFASDAIAGSVRAVARNSMEEWGPSDHCRVEIETGRQ